MPDFGVSATSLDDAIIRTDGMEPCQFADMFRSRQLDPERRMWLAVLTDAVDLLAQPDAGVTDQSRLPRLKKEARAWVEDADERVTSFIWVCEILDIDPDYLRPALLEGSTRVRKRALLGVTAG